MTFSRSASRDSGECIGGGMVFFEGGTAPYARSGYSLPGLGAGDGGSIAFMLGVALGGVVARDNA